jgi:hypothetical protein
MPFFEFEWSLRWLKYTQALLLPKLFKDKGKYLHVHRLDFSLPANVRLGVFETEVYGSTDSISRSLEPVYLMPFVPYLFAQHFVGDRDNSALGLDISVGTLRGFEFYAELFIDDLDNLLGFWDSNWWGDKWALSVGAKTEALRVGPFEWSANLEYTRIEPWVWTHHLGDGTNYLHYGQNMGSDLGPNSQEVYAALALEWQKKLRLELSVSAVAKDTARGGNIADIHDYALDGDGKKFLSPASTFRYQAYTASLRFSPWDFVSARVAFTQLAGFYKGQRLETALGVQW